MPLTGPIDPEQVRTHARLLPAEVLSLIDEPFIRSCLLYDEFVRRLALRVFRAARLEVAARVEGTPEEIASRAGLDPVRTAVPVSWFMRFLADHGDLRRADTGPADSAERFCLDGAIPDPDPREPLEEQMQLAPSWLPSYRIAEVAADDYTAFLRGEKSGEEILFAPGRLDLWTGYFSNDNGLYAVNNRLGAIAAEAWLPSPSSDPSAPGGAEASACAAMADPLPRNVKPAAALSGGSARSGTTILELGGGLGSAALALLGRLETAGRIEEISAYCFTELVPAFLRKGQKAVREAYPDAGFLSFARLDMDRPFAEQGVAPGSFSMVHAVNTVHIARDLGFTLGEIRGALKPGGIVLMPECVRPRPGRANYVEFVFNLMEPFRRPGGGFLTPEQWCAALEEAGFVDVRFLPDLRLLRDELPSFYASAVGAAARAGSSQKG